MTTEMPMRSDSYLQRLKSSLSASAVLKAELGVAKSSSAGIKIFAYEGVDDKLIYSHWLSKFQPDILYEPFICRNKNQLLQLWSSLKSDLSGMGKNVYFFTDRDFDDLKGNELDDSIFMTEKYSVENYLVETEILEEILKIEFHCHGSSSIRAEIGELFKSDYDSFLDVTSDINFRIYLARKCKIRQLRELSVRIDELAEIKISDVKKGNGKIEDMVCLEREPSGSEVDEHRVKFMELEKRSRYRGKFALMFFRKWLALLLVERNSNNTGLFGQLPQHEFIAKGGFSFDQLAAKSKAPLAFKIFIKNIGSRTQEEIAVF